MQVGSFYSKWSPNQLQVGHLERQSYHPHQAVYQHGFQKANEAIPSAEYAVLQFALSHKGPVKFTKPNVYQI